MPDSNALNIAVLTGEVVALDLDIDDQELVDQAAHLVEREVGPTPLIRQGRVPKLAFFYRAAAPFKKIRTAEMKLYDDRKVMAEALGEGQSILIDGVHAETGRSYRWLDQHPLDVPLSGLPSITEECARALIEEIERLLRDAGAVDIHPKADRREYRHRNGGGDSFWRNVCYLALEEPGCWLRSIFPDAKLAPNGAWRIPAKQRGLPSSKQDISISKDGIKDFADNEKGYTPIEFVRIFGPEKDPVKAAHWLCERLGVQPERLGWRVGTVPPPANYDGPDGPRDDDPPGSGDDGPPGPEPPSLDHPPEGSQPPRIVWVLGGLRNQAADEGVAALQAADLGLFVRDQQLVRIAPTNMKASDGSTITNPTISVVSRAGLGRMLNQSAKWMKIDSKGQIIRIDPPLPVVIEILEAMQDRWPFPPLMGIVRTPTMRPDYSLITAEGFDAATGLWADFGGLQVPAIPERPSRREAETAVATILDIVTTFPFVDEPSRSVAVSGLVTPTIRPACEVVPVHLASSPSSGSGKSYYVDCVSAVATGERAAVIAMAPKEDETEKRLVGATLGGHPIIAIDNIRRLFQGDYLCQMTERPMLQPRPLGTSKMPQIKNNFSTYGTGNNMVTADDMVRRCIQAAMDPNVAEPESREFTRDPRREILSNRGRYIAAALTIPRYYIAAGMPNRLPPLASYGQWSDLVRSALVHLGLADPVKTMETLRAEDPGRQHRGEIFATWAN
jgi:putative DNA primase/helicase